MQRSITSPKEWPGYVLTGDEWVIDGNYTIHNNIDNSIFILKLIKVWFMLGLVFGWSCYFKCYRCRKVYHLQFVSSIYLEEDNYDMMMIWPHYRAMG